MTRRSIRQERLAISTSHYLNILACWLTLLWYGRVPVEAGTKETRAWRDESMRPQGLVGCLYC